MKNNIQKCILRFYLEKLNLIRQWYHANNTVVFKWLSNSMVVDFVDISAGVAQILGH